MNYDVDIEAVLMSRDDMMNGDVVLYYLYIIYQPFCLQVDANTSL